MKCFECNNVAMHEISFGVESFDLCTECYREVLQECVARNVLPTMIVSV